MNGRVYDPYLGRFISADTVIQNLAATQSVNPYSYAWNDPLKYVDPSGHSLLGSILGLLAAIIVMWFAPEFFLINFEIEVSTAFVLAGALAGFVGGFLGALVSTGSLSAALTAGLIGGITGAAFAAVGNWAQAGAGWDIGERVIAHAAVGCGSAMLSGGNCGKGAAAAALGELATATDFIQTPKSIGDYWGTFKGAAEAGLVGGAASEITGGGFSEGFSTAAAGYLFNDVAHAIGHRQVVIQRNDGSQEVRSDGSRSWRDNNPGNMISGVGSDQSIGMDPDPGSHDKAIFADYATGWDAMIKNLNSSRYQSLTVGDAIDTWAPGSDNNDPVHYAATIQSWTGISVTTQMSTLSALQIEAVAGAIQRFEGWSVGTVSIIHPE
jgi:hypothetical protein